VDEYPRGGVGWMVGWGVGSGGSRWSWLMSHSYLQLAAVKRAAGDSSEHGRDPLSPPLHMFTGQ